jgi:hypothetical protein
VAIVYIETNFLLGMNLGQDPDAITVLDEAARDPSLQLVIPGVCFMEALSAFKEIIHERANLKLKIDREIRELERNKTSPIAKQLLEQLNQSTITYLDYTKDLKLDFQSTIRRVGRITRMIALTKVNLRKGFAGILVDSKHDYLILPDNLIVQCILEDARRHPVKTKAFFSGNSTDFDKPRVREALRQAGIEKYFTASGNALGWYRSLPSE